MSQGPGRTRSAGPTRSGAAARSRSTDGSRARTGSTSRPATARPAAAPPGAAPRTRDRGQVKAGEQSNHRPRRSRLLRQAAVLAAVLVVVATLLAFPLRNLLDQQTALEAEKAKEATLREQLADLQDQRVALNDPDYIRAQARARLQYVNPGDTVYVVDAPKLEVAAGTGHTPAAAEKPWFDDLWSSVSEPTS